MPKELEERLRQEGIRKGYKGERLNAYIYGSKALQAWRDKQGKKKPKGK